MENLKSIFEDLFKFKYNESVKHKGDNKGNMSSDMGLLILHRELVEVVNDENIHTYEKHYYCRVIRFSGSGDIMRFKENELMSIREYDEEQIKNEFERNAMRDEMRKIQQEVYKAFGVDKNSILKLKAEPEKEYSVTGFQSNKDTNKYELLIRQNGGLETGRNKESVKSTDEFDVVS